MSKSIDVNLSEQQLDLLKRGLRFVKRAVALDMHDPTEESIQKRKDELSEIAKLSEIVEGFIPSTANP